MLNIIKRTPYQIAFLVFFTIILQSVYGFYAIYDLSPPASIVMLGYILIFWLVGDWFMKDSKQHDVEWAFDMGFFLYLSWPLFIPFYIYKTRGLKKAILVTISFPALYFGTFFLSYHLLYSIVPDEINLGIKYMEISFLTTQVDIIRTGV